MHNIINVIDKYPYQELELPETEGAPGLVALLLYNLIKEIEGKDEITNLDNELWEMGFYEELCMKQTTTTRFRGDEMGMNRILKALKESNRELDRVLKSHDHADKLMLLKKNFELQLKFTNSYLRGQKILQQFKKDSKHSPTLESLVGSIAKKEELETVREIKKQMREKLLRLKERIKKEE